MSILLKGVFNCSSAFGACKLSLVEKFLSRQLTVVVNSFFNIGQRQIVHYNNNIMKNLLASKYFSFNTSADHNGSTAVTSLSSVVLLFDHMLSYYDASNRSKSSISLATALAKDI